MSHADAKNVVQTDVLMETNRFLMSTPEPEMNVDDNDGVITNNYQDLDLLSPISLQNNNFNLKHYGEFTITLRKVNGSLGFSLYSQTDDSTLLRHSVKALVKEPALSDGRIRAGDKLVAANGIECGHLSHQELIQVFLPRLTRSVFLKKCPFPASFLYFRLFNTAFLKLFVNKICRWLDSNCGSLVSEATPLPMQFQPMPINMICLYQNCFD